MDGCNIANTLRTPILEKHLNIGDLNHVTYGLSLLNTSI